MRCPYCGAEVVGRKCVFCTSDLIEHIKKNGLEIDDFAEETPAKKEEKKKTETEKKKSKKKRDQADVNDAIRDLCKDLLSSNRDDFGAYDAGWRHIGGESVKNRLFEVLNIPRGEEVFLIHDDTLMSNGKNGFAITDHGFYCKELWESLSTVHFEDIKASDRIVKGDYTIYLTEKGRTIAYLSGSQEVLERLRKLYVDILNVMFEEE